MSHVEGKHDFPEITNNEDQLDILLQMQKTACMLPLGLDTVVRFKTNFDHQISSEVVLACDDVMRPIKRNLPTC